jgi:hypothetical protein
MVFNYAAYQAELRAAAARAAAQRAAAARQEAQLAQQRAAAQAQAAAQRAAAARQEAMTTSARVPNTNSYSPPVYVAPSPPPPPAPPPPPPPPVSPGNQSIKIATRDLFIGDEVVDADASFSKLVGDIASTEFLEINRLGSVDGTDQAYLPITGLADLNMQNDPRKIIALQNTSDEYFRQFSVPLENYLPSEGNGPDGEIVYIDRDPTSTTYNNLVINTVNLKETERIEVEFIYFDTATNVRWYN